MARTKSTAVTLPNLGLFLNVPPLNVPARGLLDGYNFRIEDGRVSNINLGWTRLGEFVLNGPVIYFDFFFVDGVNERDVFFTPTDAYSYNPTDDSVVFITPAYTEGTAAATGTAVTAGGGADWTDIKAGDFISFGDAQENDPEADWYEITGANASTITLKTPGVPSPVSAGAYTIRRTFVGKVQDRWSSDVFPQAGGNDDLWLATNGVDPIIKWDGTTRFIEHADLSFTARTLRVYSNMMFYGAPTVSGTYYPSSFINSNAGDPENTSTGLASQLIAYSGSNPILAMYPMGDNLVIYSKRKVTLAQFVGGDINFVLRQTVNEVGPISGGLIADLGDFHEFIGVDAQYYFDGVSVKESGAQVWRAILKQRDPAREPTSFIHFNEEHGDLMWFVPLVNDSGVGDEDAPPETAHVEHYLEEVGDKEESPYSRRYAPFLSAGYTEQRSSLTFDTVEGTFSDLNFRFNDQFFFVAFPISIMGDADGKVWKLNTAQYADGDPLPSFIRLGRRALGDGRMRGLLSRVYPFASQFVNSQLDVTLRLSDHAMGPITSTGSFVFDTALPEGGHFVSTFRRGRFVEVEFGNASGDPWELSGWDFDIKSGGER